MIINKKDPYTKEEVKKVAEEFATYVKTVIDIELKICSAGANRHFESERTLLDEGSSQSNLWGGGVDLKTMAIDNTSVINIRPNDNNTSNEIQDPKKRAEFERLMKYFFSKSWTK